VEVNKRNNQPLNSFTIPERVVGIPVIFLLPVFF
jgi:hypothetical protein